MKRVIHFEIHAEQPERAVKFYQDLLGWDITKWDGPSPYWLASTGHEGQPGINGGIMARMGPPPTEGQAVNAYVCTIDVEDLDAMLVKLTQSGGSVALPRIAVPGIGWLAYGKDTEGNIFGMMQTDEKAG
jgi:predicted enzyme related to lactoylglutathione lyase